MRRMALELVPAGDGALAQFLTAADDLEAAARLALPYRKGQAPVALLGDHPVGHRAQPVELALVAEPGDPLDLVDDVHDLVAQAALLLFGRHLVARLVVRLAHRDVPLVDHAKQKGRAAAPAMRIAVRVRLEVVEERALLEVLDDARRHAM